MVTNLLIGQLHATCLRTCLTSLEELEHLDRLQQPQPKYETHSIVWVTDSKRVCGPKLFFSNSGRILHREPRLLTLICPGGTPMELPPIPMSGESAALGAPASVAPILDPAPASSLAPTSALSPATPRSPGSFPSRRRPVHLPGSDGGRPSTSPRGSTARPVPLVTDGGGLWGAELMAAPVLQP